MTWQVKPAPHLKNNSADTPFVETGFETLEMKFETMNHHKKIAETRNVMSLKLNATKALFCLILNLSAGCTHQLTLKTEPTGAKIFALDQKGQRAAQLGESPLILKEAPDKDYYFFEVTKDGFDTRVFFSPEVGASNQEILLKLRPMDREFFDSQFKKDRAVIINNAFSALLSLQAAVLEKNTKLVADLSKALANDFDEVSYFHSLLGNFHYLSGNPTEALKRYERAAELDPANSEASAMIKIIRLQPRRSENQNKAKEPLPARPNSNTQDGGSK